MQRRTEGPQYPDLSGRGTLWGTHELLGAAKSSGAYRIRTCDFHRVRMALYR